jgi:hypothetical protein
MDWEYKLKPLKQIRDWYKDKEKRNISGFTDFEDFRNWYEENVQDKFCFYCGLTERELQKIVHLGILTSNRFPMNGVFLRGKNRGYWLEVDKKNPKTNYSRENCVPCCYLCNNDKSDVFDGEKYKEFLEDRPGYIRRLLDKH